MQYQMTSCLLTDLEIEYINIYLCMHVCFDDTLRRQQRDEKIELSRSRCSSYMLGEKSSKLDSQSYEQDQLRMNDLE